jgi:hypothetical protein
VYLKLGPEILEFENKCVQFEIQKYNLKKNKAQTPT